MRMGKLPMTIVSNYLFLTLIPILAIRKREKIYVELEFETDIS